MSYLLFMDESGHDHKIIPYEVRGGIAIHASKVWSFVTSMKSSEESCFGELLTLYGQEIKGSKLLKKQCIKWANQHERLDDDARRKNATAFLKKGSRKETPTKMEFTAYGQACLEMVQSIFNELLNHDAKLFASIIPKSTEKPLNFKNRNYMRKDHVFLMERFYNFLESKQEHGLLIMDETDNSFDRQFVRKMEAYYTKTYTGRQRASWIVPSPFFVSSEMTYPIQAADVCIYCLNWGFRIPKCGINAEVRKDVADLSELWIKRLQFKGEVDKEGKQFPTYGICYVPDPYSSRE